MTAHHAALENINSIRQHARNMIVKGNADSEFVTGLNWAFESIIRYCDTMEQFERAHPTFTTEV